MFFFSFRVPFLFASIGNYWKFQEGVLAAHLRVRTREMVLVQPIQCSALFFRMTWKHTGPKNRFLNSEIHQVTKIWRKVAEKEKALLMKVRAGGPGLASSVSGHPSRPFTPSPLSHSLLLTRLLTLRTVALVSFIHMSEICAPLTAASDHGVRGRGRQPPLSYHPTLQQALAPTKVTAQGFKGPAAFLPHPLRTSYFSFYPFGSQVLPIYSKTTANVGEIRK